MNKISMTYLLCLTLFSTTVFAQTPKENLAKGIDTYNALREYSRTLTAETLTDENMGDVKNRVELGTPLFDKVVKEGTADQIRVARYFKATLQYELAYMYALKGDNDAAYDALKALESGITAYKSSDFPMTYDYSSKIFKITWENFAAVQAEYFSTFGETSYNLTKYEDAYASMKNVLAIKNASAWLRYTAVNKILDIRTKNKALVSDDDYPNFSLKSMKTYADLSAEDKKTVVDNNYPTWERGYKIFNNSIDNVPNSQNLTPKIGEAALILRGLNENEKAAKFFTFALKNGWGTTMIWKNDVLPTAKNANDKTLGISV
jgi:rhodanese-related sulfurtransferase